MNPSFTQLSFTMKSYLPLFSDKYRMGIFFRCHF